VVGIMPPKVGTTGSRLPIRPCDALRSLARRIRRHPRTNVSQIVALGRLLMQVRTKVGHGHFESWLVSIDADYSLRTSRECMTAARRLGGCKELAGLLARFTPSSLRILCRPKVLRSAELLADLAALAKQSKRIGFSEAREAVTNTRPDAVYPTPGNVAESPQAKLGRLLVELVVAEDTSGVHIYPDNDPDCPTVAVHVLGKEIKSYTRSHLVNALEAAAGVEELRKCPRCKNPFLPAMFSKKAHYCKICERKRVKAHTDLKRSKKRKPSAGDEQAPQAPA
jgi:hypothetical protein